MVSMALKPTEDEVTRFADMFSAMGTGARLRIMRVLLSAHPDGMIVKGFVRICPIFSVFTASGPRLIRRDR